MEISACWMMQGTRHLLVWFFGQCWNQIGTEGTKCATVLGNRLLFIHVNQSMLVFTVKHSGCLKFHLSLSSLGNMLHCVSNICPYHHSVVAWKASWLQHIMATKAMHECYCTIKLLISLSVKACVQGLEELPSFGDSTTGSSSFQWTTLRVLRKGWPEVNGPCSSSLC